MSDQRAAQQKGLVRRFEHWHQVCRLGMLQQLGAMPAPGRGSG